MADHHTPPLAPIQHSSGTRKNVLLITPVAPWKLFGGTPIVSRGLIALFSKAVDLQVCCLRSEEPGEYPQTVNGATVLTGPVSAFARKLKFFFDFSAASFAHRQFQKSVVRARLAALIAEQRPNFVIFDHIYSSWLIDLVENPATRVIYIAHDDMVAYADSLLRLRPGFLKRLRFAALRRQYRSLQEKVLRRADFTLTMTPEDATRLRPSTHGLVEVAPLIFDFPADDRAYAAEFRYLLVTGSFDTWEKKLGFTQFLAAVFVPLVRDRPEWRLVVAGRIPADVLAQMPFAEPQIRILQAPSATAMREAVRDASAAVVLDLQASGLKIKTMELAASGLPLVSWPPGLEGTMLDPGRSCLRAESATEFVAHLDRLYLEPDARRSIGVAAQAAARAQFSAEAAQIRLRSSSLFAAFAAAGALRSSPGLWGA